MKLFKNLHARAQKAYIQTQVRLIHLVRSESGQGTTEYAILVGVLVVIAILSIISFKGKVQELWDAIKNGIEQL